MGRWPIAGVALCWACSSTEAPMFLDLGPLDRELVLLAAVDDEDRLVETTLIDWGKEPLPTSLRSVPAGGRLLGLAFNRADLWAGSPRLDEAQLETLTVEGRAVAAENCVEGVFDAGRSRSLVRWPVGTRAFEADLERAALIDRSLSEPWFARMLPSVPVRADRCVGHPEIQFRPFAPETPILDSGAIIAGAPAQLGAPDLDEFVRVDEARLLLAYNQHLVIAEQGVGYVDAPGRALVIEAPLRFRSIAVGPPTDAAGTRRVVFVSVDGDPDLEATRSTLSESTLLGWALTEPRVILESDAILDAVYLRPDDGRLIVFEKPGTFHQERTAGGMLEVVAEFTDQQFSLEKRGRFVASGLSSHPLALLGVGPNTIFLGSADGTEWTSLQEGLTLGLTVRAFAASSPPGRETILYAGNSGGQVFEKKLTAGAWSLLDLRVDSALVAAGCARFEETASCGFAVPRWGWRGFTGFTDAFGEPAVLAFSGACSVAFVLKQGGCGSSVVLDELGPAGRDNSDEIFASRSEAGYVTFATERGGIYEIPWSVLGLEP